MAVRTAAKAAAKKALTKMDSPLALIAGVTVGILALGIVVQVLLIVASIFSSKSAGGSSRPKRERKPSTKAIEAAPAPAKKASKPAKKSSSKKAAAPAKKAPAKKAPAKKASSKKAAPKKTSSKSVVSPRRSSRTPSKKR
jgi:heme/copper-type cytochrome/quinol oxidase subunit 1